MRRPVQRLRRRPARERGAVLIVGLMLLLVLTLLGVTAMHNALLEQKMAGNVQDASAAWQAAEAALRDGELFLQQPEVPEFDGTGGLYPPPGSPPDPPRWTTVDWQSDRAVRIYRGFEDAPGSLSRVTARYFIEQLPPAIGPGESLSADTPREAAGLYRITARGTGAGGGAAVILQSTYKR